MDIDEESKRNLIESFGQKIALRGRGESVREELENLERVWVQQLNPQQIEDAQRALWIRLVPISIEANNVDLALLLVAKLKLVRLVNIIQSTLIPKATKLGVAVALNYVANEFGLESNLDLNDLLNIEPDKPRSLFDIDQLTQLHVHKARWSEALDSTDRAFDGLQADLNRRRIRFRWARFLEADDNFTAAIEQHELAQTESDHVIRLLLKQHLNRASQEIRNYCLSSSRDLSSLTIQNFKIFAERPEIREQIRSVWANRHLGCYTSQLFPQIASIDRGEIDWLERRTYEALPDVNTRDLITSNEIDSRTVGILMNAGSSLSEIPRSRLADLTSWYYRDPSRSMSVSKMHLVLGVPEGFTRVKSSDRWTQLEMITPHLVDHELLGIELCELLGRHRGQQVKCRGLAFMLIRLGLADEALHEIAVLLEEESGHVALSELVEWFGTTIETRIAREEGWNWIDPVLSEATLLELHEILLRDREAEEKQQATDVIRYVIFALIIFLDKLNNNDEESEQQTTTNLVSSGKSNWLQKMEIMFKYLGKILNDFGLSLGEENTNNHGIIKATSLLMKAAKSKLDAIQNSEMILNSFRQLVDRVASRCLMESRYKQAASLFSQMGNQIEACKCLMRTGDIEVVIKFAILTNDIAVNRITLNYLRHLNTSQDVIRDFMARTKLVANENLE